jgi:hypothetical protein
LQCKHSQSGNDVGQRYVSVGSLGVLDSSKPLLVLVEGLLPSLLLRLVLYLQVIDLLHLPFRDLYSGGDGNDSREISSYNDLDF